MEKIYLFYMVMGFCLGSILYAYEIPRMVKHVDIRQISEDGERGRIPCYVRECWLRLCLAMPFPLSIREKAVRELQSASACCLDFFHGGRLC